MLTHNSVFPLPKQSSRPDFPPFYTQFEVLKSTADNSPSNAILALSGASLPDFQLKTDSLLSDTHLIPSTVSAINSKLDPHNTLDVIPAKVPMICAPQLAPVL